LLEKLLPMYVHVLIYRALVDTSAGENGARMAAMDNATRNCEDLIQNLTLKYNKVRQSAITAELMDIVGGTEALAKG
jgi:F-type H+-transporting ATPase subunit gamma